MNFSYRKFPVDSKNCPFPDKKSALRPVIQIDFGGISRKFSYLVLIDSGADYCVFHAKVGELLGLDIKSGKLVTFYGTSGQPQIAYFHAVSFKIGGHDHICEAGFSYEMERLPYGLLGQDGFFNKWIVKFEYHKENIELKEIPDHRKTR